MIDLYTWHTPNGRKVSIALEELGLAYEAHAVNIGEGEQFEPSFLEVSPNNKIPAIRDLETGVTLMESGTILHYLAKKTGRLLPRDPAARWRAHEWLTWQMAGFGPVLGQCHHFLKFNPGSSEYAEKRFHAEALRLYGVLDRRLEGRDFVAGEYSIADIALWPWVARFEWHQIDLGDFPAVRSWYRRILERPAVERGYHVPGKVQEIPVP